MFFTSNIFSSEFSTQNNLNAVAPQTDSFFFRAFKNCQSVAQAALATKFIQGIKNGNLLPDMYGALNVLDSHYCYNGAASFQIAYDRTVPSEMHLKNVLRIMQQSYTEYNKTFLDVWHLPETAQILPTDTCSQYIAHERGVAQNYDPIYTLVSMLPCYYLWYWLSDQIYAHRANNIYAYWIEGCHSPDTAYSIGNLIADWQKQGKRFDEQLAMTIYYKSMNYELRMFSDACSDPRLTELLA